MNLQDSLKSIILDLFLKNKNGTIAELSGLYLEHV